MKQHTFLALACGMGGASVGFHDAGYECVGAFDLDPEACADHECLTGFPAHIADLAEIQPHELRARCSGRPDVVITSPPCKGFSGCLPAKMSRTEKYRQLNSLAERTIWLVLEAWPESPPPLILMENVPRILSRGREWLDGVQDLLRVYGYACRETTHDCGELGGLAQHRRRFLMVARHRKQIPDETPLHVPPVQRVRGIGEVLGSLPVPLPNSDAGGPMHSLPKLAPINWVRLALIPAGGDWRDLPESVGLSPRDGRQNGGFGVEDFEQPAHAVIAEGTVRNTRASVADPRVLTDLYPSSYGVADGAEPAKTVRGSQRVQNTEASIADPRLNCSPRATVYGVASREEPANTVVGNARHDNGTYSIADPRVECKRREGGHGVKGWSEASAPVIANATLHNWPAGVADPRLDHDTRKGNLHVHDWAKPSHVVIGDCRSYKGANVADPRSVIVGDPELTWGQGRDGKTILLNGSYSPTHMIIRAADGSWHRPMTTLELAALQGFPVMVGDGWLKLAGGAHGRWRQRIGNAIPPPAAEAIARAMADTLEAAAEGTFKLNALPVWVDHENHHAAE